MAEPVDTKHATDEEPVMESSTAEETTPLLASEQVLYRTSSKSSQNVETDPKPRDERSVFGIISVLLIGVFVSSADTTLVMATFAEIASDFDRLESGSWLLSSFGLAACVTQPLV